MHNHIYNICDKKYKKGEFKFKWDNDRSNFEEIDTKLKNASKTNKKNRNRGYPDLIYFNPNTKMLILIEIKGDKAKHSSNKLNDIENPKEFAVDGALHYSTFFYEYDRFAIAISGNPDNYLMDQFLINKNSNIPVHIPVQRILNEFDYENIISDSLISKKIDSLSSTLSNLNKDMDDYKIDASKRPIILGSIIFSLIHFKQMKTDIESIKYNSNNISNLLIDSIKLKMKNVLPKNKWEDNDKIINRFCDLIKSYSINNIVWQKIIKRVDTELMPIINKMKKETYHDFSGDMYRVLLRYTSGDGKILGQVLTPKHIANLMIELADIKKSDSILDPACGTGIFLVNSMNKLISFATNDKEISEIKSKKIYGIEISKEMFFLTLVNMLINDDGKTNIYIDDDNPNIAKRGIFKYKKNDFNEQPKKIIMNPPYLTHNEMWDFILTSMELASEKAVIIIPTSILNRNKKYKEIFLRKHSLKSVINMPNNIFQNKSSSGSSIKTSIIVGEINKPNKNNYEGTYFYDLKDDGFISSKKHGRYDGNNKWNLIKDNFMQDYFLKKEVKNTSKLVKTLTSNDSWHFNYFNKVCAEDFKGINDYLFSLFYALMNKKNMNNLIRLIVASKLIANVSIENFNVEKVKSFKAKDILILENTYNKALRIEKYDGIKGNLSYISAANQNNGSRLDNTRNIYNETVFENKITWNSQGDGGAGLSFYHPYKFIVSSTTFVFDTIKNQTWKEKLFLAFAMSLEKKNRYHGNSITKNEFKNGTLLITLPVTSDNKINWELINKFMNKSDIVRAIKKLIS